MAEGGRKKPGGKKNEKKENNDNSGNGKVKGSKKASRGGKRSGGKMKFNMDIFSEEAMNDAYYTCHNIMDVLFCRGFSWPDAQKKKKKKSKR